MDDVDLDYIRNDYLRHGRHSERAEEFDIVIRRELAVAWDKGVRSVWWNEIFSDTEWPDNPYEGTQND